jgi:hypothetical protein
VWTQALVIALAMAFLTAPTARAEARKRRDAHRGAGEEEVTKRVLPPRAAACGSQRPEATPSDDSCASPCCRESGLFCCCPPFVAPCASELGGGACMSPDVLAPPCDVSVYPPVTAGAPFLYGESVIE